MAATMLAAAEALAARLATVDKLRTFDHVPDSFAVPCAYVTPDRVDYWEGFSGGNPVARFTITVVVGRTADRHAQHAIYDFISYSGARSVRAVLESDRTLGGVVDTLLVESADNIRILSQGDADYLGVDFTVRVHP